MKTTRALFAVNHSCLLASDPSASARFFVTNLGYTHVRRGYNSDGSVSTEFVADPYSVELEFYRPEKGVQKDQIPVYSHVALEATEETFAAQLKQLMDAGAVPVADESADDPVKQFCVLQVPGGVMVQLMNRRKPAFFFEPLPQKDMLG